LPTPRPQGIRLTIEQEERYWRRNLAVSLAAVGHQASRPEAISKDFSPFARKNASKLCRARSVNLARASRPTRRKSGQTRATLKRPEFQLAWRTVRVSPDCRAPQQARLSLALGVSCWARTAPLRHVRVAGRVIFTVDGHSLLGNAKRLHRLRRSFCRSWRNDKWRDLLLTFWFRITDGADFVDVLMGQGEAMRLTRLMVKRSLRL
jgi:hypothetical protein